MAKPSQDSISSDCCLLNLTCEEEFGHVSSFENEKVYSVIMVWILDLLHLSVGLWYALKLEGFFIFCSFGWCGIGNKQIKTLLKKHDALQEGSQK